jgi:hypothetical protein
MNKVKRFIGASTHEKTMAAQTLFWLWFFGLRNTILPYRVTKRWLSEEIGDYSTVRLRDEMTIRKVTGLVRLLKQYAPRANCLTQALATKAVLRSYGQNANIRLGVVRSDISIDAHAWVEIEGHIILGKQPNNSRYSILRSGTST